MNFLQSCALLNILILACIKSNFKFLFSASQLLKIKGIGYTVLNDWQQSELALPKTGKKYFEPNGSWLQDMQLENGLKNRKRLIELERVDRNSQLAIAEWLPGIQKAKVTKKSGQKWENFGHEERGQMHLLPEEALILLEMVSYFILFIYFLLSITSLVNCKLIYFILELSRTSLEWNAHFHSTSV